MKTIATLVAIVCLASCSVRVNPDGSKDVSVDAPSAMRVIEILSEK